MHNKGGIATEWKLLGGTDRLNKQCVMTATNDPEIDNTETTESGQEAKLTFATAICSWRSRETGSHKACMKETNRNRRRFNLKKKNIANSDDLTHVDVFYISNSDILSTKNSFETRFHGPSAFWTHEWTDKRYRHMFAHSTLISITALSVSHIELIDHPISIAQQ